MKWADRAVLLILGLYCLTGRPVDALSVAALLAAVTAGCLLGELSGRWVSAGIGLLWVVLTILWLPFGFFCALLLYDLLSVPWTSRRGHLAGRAVWLTASALLLVGKQAYTVRELLVMLFGMALALLLESARTRVTQLVRTVRTVRDEATEMNRRLDDQNKRILAARDDSMKLATLIERGRIARDMHDSVGHILARALLQTGALMAVSREEKTAEGLGALRDTLTQAINCVRQSVHDLRDQSMDLYTLVQAALRDFSAYDCNLNFDMGEGVPQAVQSCFAGVIHEALANVARHSNATQIRIDLQEHPAFYCLTFEDNGTPRPEKSTGAHEGMGLDDMRERAFALGGQLSIHRERGFGIHVTIPKTQGGEPR